MINQLGLLNEPQTEGRWPLPEGWEWKPISSIAVDTTRYNPTTKPTSLFQYVDISAIDNEKGIIQLDKVRMLPGSEAPRRARKIIKTSDVIVGTTRPNLKNIALVPESLHEQVCSTGFCVLRTKDGIALPEYLYFACRAGFFIDQLTPRGLAYPTVNDAAVFGASIPVPYPNDPARSLTRQRAIVTRIQTLFAELGKLRELHDEIDRDVDQLIGSVLEEVYPSIDQPLPDNWSLKQVRDLSENTQYGHTRPSRLEPIGPKFLRITDIQDGRVDWENVLYCEISLKDEQKYMLQDGDIVFARSGATTGKTYLVQHPPRSVFASYLIRLRLRNVLPEFVYWFFQTNDYWKQVIPQGAVQPNMNAQLLQKIKVPVPVTEEVQRQIIAYVRSIQPEIQDIRELQSADATHFQQAELAILEYAFRGEL